MPMVYQLSYGKPGKKALKGGNKKEGFTPPAEPPVAAGSLKKPAPPVDKANGVWSLPYIELKKSSALSMFTYKR